MNKLKEIRIRQVVLYIAWYTYIIIWAWANRNADLTTLDIIIGFVVPLIAVMWASVSLSNRLRREKQQEKQRLVDEERIQGGMEMFG